MQCMREVYIDINRPAPSLLEQLKGLGVSTIYEVLGKEMLLDRSIRPVCNGHSIAGPAVIAVNTPGDYLTMHYGLSLTQPGDVFVITFTESPTLNAVWGGLATLSGVGRGIVGVITDGGVRDVKEIKEYNFPVWSKAISAERSRKERIGGINIPATCGGVLIYPGDIIVADEDGVVVVPIDDAEAVLKRGLERERIEAKMKELLLEGKTPFELFNMKNAFEENSPLIIEGKYLGKRGDNNANR
ncbi:4-carboxy-4-hydroxy-2-oxoadipate aldolase/oxaloacetate decarboxylase [Robertmurraya kyonggiensis]|uniref:Putative 4-hydroxy-4-methyl-2-oxoglutarate aldolase n=1 Tax=Robertmurraya kyonggiensis TaxID=1037680 RepID=A0A4U1DAA8_9BACI|nr:4-carboxy-4-hydroxy-2-oxoadipate aldolase/oxaloacetate decarboxylase [Robertmurraya kyonggiensis]TKC19462.1 4-carboxy-4-hydroxy-2-oxoadipate aldolase/oxaloacetate decarboxylase [Robertmurraya kyonggiensis]